MNTATAQTPRLAISAGDPAGIGPDVVLALAQGDWPAELVVIADRDMLAARAALLGANVTLQEYSPAAAPRATVRGALRVLHQPLAQAPVPGTPHPCNAAAVLRALDTATQGCLDGQFHALVTAPVSKAVIAESGVPFSGHTEYLAALTGTPQVVMLLATGDLRVALATTHIPLAEVPAAITRERLRQILAVLHTGLQARFAIAAPRIAVLGLNPHAGESGRLGREEMEVIAPLLKEMREESYELLGPLAADTAFREETRRRADAYLAMYHDQGLPVLKYAGFGSAVNITLGLPIIRTSVDHGTAFELAGSGRADSGSMRAAVTQALELIALQH